MKLSCLAVFWLLAATRIAAPLPGAEPPYFVTYGHRMEEPGSLEIASYQVSGSPKGGNTFLNTVLELEYGVQAWWSAELYLSGQSTRNESTLFTGYRFENRFRPLFREHWINPVIYVEYADINGADKSLLEIVGHDGRDDQRQPNDEARRERKREIETKLILSSNFRGWNVSENFIAEKNLANQPWEFGYAFGFNRPLALSARPKACRLCPENFRAGIEMYGGLGTRYEFGLHDTSHYFAPVLAWLFAPGAALQFSVAFGLNGNSHDRLYRFGVSREIPRFDRLLRNQRSGPG